MSGRRFHLEGRTSASPLRVEPRPAVGRVSRRASGRVPLARSPIGLGWTEFGASFDEGARCVRYVWMHIPTNTLVISAVDLAELPRSGLTGPQWHIAISDRSTDVAVRPHDTQVEVARCAFDMLAASEGARDATEARHFWLPIEARERLDESQVAT